MGSSSSSSGTSGFTRRDSRDFEYRAIGSDSTSIVPSMSSHSPPSTENCPANVVVSVTSYQPSPEYVADTSSDGYGLPGFEVVIVLPSPRSQ